MSEGTNHNDLHGNDTLDRSLAALKQERVPDGPSADVIARTLGVVLSTMVSSRPVTPAVLAPNIMEDSAQAFQ